MEQHGLEASFGRRAFLEPVALDGEEQGAAQVAVDLESRLRGQAPGVGGPPSSGRPVPLVGRFVALVARHHRGYQGDHERGRHPDQKAPKPAIDPPLSPETALDVRRLPLLLRRAGREELGLGRRKLRAVATHPFRGRLEARTAVQLGCVVAPFGPVLGRRAQMGVDPLTILVLLQPPLEAWPCPGQRLVSDLERVLARRAAVGPAPACSPRRPGWPPASCGRAGAAPHSPSPAVLTSRRKSERATGRWCSGSEA